MANFCYPLLEILGPMWCPIETYFEPLDPVWKQFKRVLGPSKKCPLRIQMDSRFFLSSFENPGDHLVSYWNIFGALGSYLETV